VGEGAAPSGQLGAVPVREPGATVPRSRHKLEEIVAKLCQVDVLFSPGQSVADAIRSIGVAEATYAAGVRLLTCRCARTVMGEVPRMDERVRRLAEQLLDTGLDKLSERERRVITRVAERSQISRDVNRAFDEKQTLADRLADRVARFGGSWTFIILFLATLVAWAVLNSIVLAWYSTAFDPYPYIFLNLMLSMLAALQAPVILMSQNRQAARDRLAAGHDYEVNLKAELEIMGLHEKLDRIRSQHLEELLRAQQEQLKLLTQLTRADGKGGGG
jgi:uncharacterized membrane protein